MDEESVMLKSQQGRKKDSVEKPARLRVRGIGIFTPSFATLLKKSLLALVSSVHQSNQRLNGQLQMQMRDKEIKSQNFLSAGQYHPNALPHFFHPLNLIFWIDMGRGIAHFG